MTDRQFPRLAPLYLIGIVLTLLGCLSIAAPSVAGTWVIGMLGVVLLIAGITQLITFWWAERRLQKISPLIIGLVSVVSGVGLLTEPWIGSKMVILVMSVFLTISGIWKIIIAFSYRPAKGWLILLVSGGIACLLGYWLYTRTPEEALDIIGILAGIDFFLTGISMLAVAITVRQLTAILEDRVKQTTATSTVDEALDN